MQATLKSFASALSSVANCENAINFTSLMVLEPCMRFTASLQGTRPLTSFIGGSTVSINYRALNPELYLEFC